VIPTVTVFEVTVPPPVEGAEAVAFNITGATVGLSVPIVNAWPVQLDVDLFTPDSVWPWGSVNAHVAVLLISCWPVVVVAIACRQNGVPLLAETLCVEGETVIAVIVLKT
jgi:hypothetical protein